MTSPVLTGTGSAHVTGTGAGFAPHRGDERLVTCVEIAWGYDPSSIATGPGAWKDVTSYVRSLSTSRGRQQELQAFESGTITLRLSNADGRFSPWNTAGAYGSGNVRIGCPIRVRISAEKSDPTGASPSVAAYDPTDGGFYHVAYGFITDISPDWIAGSPGDAWCDIQAADAFALLNRAELIDYPFPVGNALSNQGTPDGSSWGSETHGTDRVVDVINVIGVKNLLAGSYIYRETYGMGGSETAEWSTVIDTGPFLTVSANALAHIQGFAEPAFIDFYARPDNVLCYRAFSEIRNQAFDTTTIFGDNVPTEIPYTDVGPLYNDENLYNDVDLSFSMFAGGSTSSDAASDAASVATYGRRVWKRSYNVNPAWAHAQASDFVARYKDPVVHIPSIAVSLRSLTDAQRMRVLSLPIGYRVQVKRRPTTGDALTAECHFEGVQLTWEPGMTEVKAVLNLAPVRPVDTYTGPLPL